MKKIIPVVTLLFILMAFQVPRQKQRVIFFGDSITQAAVKPGGYISVLQDLLKSKGLQDQYELIGAGISGNKVTDLYLRLEEDVLAKNPNTVIIYIGVNDVWHKRGAGTGTDAPKFEKFYSTIIEKLKAKNIKVILCTPAAIGEKTDNSNEQDGDLNHYSNIIRQLAARHQLVLVDLRKAFMDYNLINNKENKESGILTTDRVHLNAKGNHFVAEEMLKGLTK